MIEDILLERIAAGENEWTEFKRDFDAPSGVLPSIVAFANGLFEGWLIFGVTDAGKIIGVSDPSYLRKQLLQLCQQQCDPPLVPHIEMLRINAVDVVVLRIHGEEMAQPYRQKERGVYSIRRGGRNEIVTSDEAVAFVEQQYRVFSPAIKELHIAGFRSLYDTTLRLKPLNIIIGPNASGKSNLFKALRFVRDLAGEGIGKVYQEMGRHLFWYGNVNESDLSFALNLTMTIPGQLGRFAPRYQVSVRLAKGNPVIDSESLTLRLDALGSEVRFIDRHGGKVQRYAEQSGVEGQSVYVPVSGRLPLRAAALATYGRETTFMPLEKLYTFIQGWRFLQVDPRVARASAIPESLDEEIPPLWDDAGNLSAVLHALQNSPSERYLFEELQQRLREAIRTLATLQVNLRPSLTGGAGKAETTFSEKFFPALAIPAESISDGTLGLLATLTALIGDPNATLICLEEPDHGLHPHLMLWLADAIRSVVDLEPEPGDEEFRRPQVVVTTHSPDFMDCFDLREEQEYLQVFIARRDQAGMTTFEPVTAEEFEPWFNDYRLGDLARKNIIDQGVF